MLDERMWRAPFGATRDCQLWLLDRSSACREFPLLFSGSRADPPLLSMLEVAQTQLQLFWAFCRRQPRSISFCPCIIARLPDYPVGMVWESSGVIKGLSSSIGKQKLSKRTWRSCIRSLHRIAHSLCRLGHWSQRFSGRSAHRRGRLTADQSKYSLRSPESASSNQLD